MCKESLPSGPQFPLNFEQMTRVPSELQPLGSWASSVPLLQAGLPALRFSYHSQAFSLVKGDQHLCRRPGPCLIRDRRYPMRMGSRNKSE